MVPPVLAGRDAEFADLHRYLQRIVAGRYDRPRLLTGDRGFGKTVLLAEFAAQARGSELSDRPAIVIDVEAVRGTNLVDQLLPVIREELRSASLDRRVGDAVRRALAFLGAVSARWGTAAVSVDLDPDDPRGGDLVTDLYELLRDLDDIARSDERAVFIIVDEVQQTSDATLGALAAALQRMNKRAADPRDAPRIGLLLAGLPDARSHLRELAGTYLQDRIRSHALGPLDEAAAAEALDGPARDAGTDWDGRALELAVGAAAGWPYALQLIGECTWDAADGDLLDAEAARRGVGAAQEELADLYAARWRELPPAERAYLAGFVSVPEASRTATTVAESMGKTPSQVATARARLVNTRRLLREDDRGSLTFSLPGFGEWVASVTRS